MTILIYDGSFEGFLCGVFYIYEHKLTDVTFQKTGYITSSFFDTTATIITESKISDRVWKTIKKTFSPQGSVNLYKAFLSELIDIENILFYVIKKTLSQKKAIDQDFSDPKVLHIAKMAKKVAREKHRMDAFVRFKLTKDGVYFATIAPDFNVIPLIGKHFKNRYADQPWIIYDVKRRYGLYYDLKTLNIIEMDLDMAVHSSTNDATFYTKEELQFQELWKHYFKSTTITSRKNMRLHLQHVPKRYWKYLSEKQ